MVRVFAGFFGLCSAPRVLTATFLTVASGLAGAVPAQAQLNPCPWINDGECDEPAGTNLCAPGTDTNDCRQGTRVLPQGAGDNSCRWAFDGECDDRTVPGHVTSACAPGTDAADCGRGIRDLPAPGGGGFFATPTIDGREIGRSGPYRVDWCLNWGQSCGDPAADAFCRRQGYREATSWRQVQHSPTVVLQGQRRLCSGGYCNALADVQCEGTGTETPDTGNTGTPPPPGGCLPDPGTLQNHGHVGQLLCFTVTGSSGMFGAGLWGGGNGIYTMNSSLAMAAVQAGVLRNGQSGRVDVLILPGQGVHRGTTRNGVTSGDSDQSGFAHHSFRIVTLAR